MKFPISLLVIVAFLVALFIFNSKTSHAPEELIAIPTTVVSFSHSPGAASSPAQPKKYQIIINDDGLSAQELNIKVRDTVTFVNKSKELVWPASGPHPIHSACPGFDALMGLNLNGTYSFTFTKAVICPFHDHLNAANANHRGKITVTE